MPKKTSTTSRPLQRWNLNTTADFNGDGKPDYVLYDANTRQTAVWYMNNNVSVSSARSIVQTGEDVESGGFYRDGHPDYEAVQSDYRPNAIWYCQTNFIGGAYGPTVPIGWALMATAD